MSKNCSVWQTYQAAVQRCEKWVVQISLRLAEYGTTTVTTYEATEQLISLHTV